MGENSSVGGLLQNQNNIQDQGHNMNKHRDPQISQTKGQIRRIHNQSNHRI